ncbi:hypothetical protein RHMOL_Rhmol05G0267900 [Rhododendron molle]|uniref:Uncharacterized protein n=1 Tax=Rhododendron molle TaxID=49168 RepID=A0ACC0NTT3_RHOML|nr:hypothetical protein RHMOL_Rhmol05G0267900 [Rhododendron molle]
MAITSQFPDGSSPLATIEQIRNRLVRPPSLHSQSSTSSTRPREDAASCYSSRFDANSTTLRRKREDQGRNVANKRLEDYLDPTILAAIRAEIGGKYRKGGGERKLIKEEVEFEWPVDELKAWTEDLRSERGVVMKRRSDGEAVDLGDDVDGIRGGRDDDDVGGGVCCSPFQWFERTALKRFKG